LQSRIQCINAAQTSYEGGKIASQANPIFQKLRAGGRQANNIAENETNFIRFFLRMQKAEINKLRA